MNFSVKSEEWVVLYLQVIDFHDQTNTVLGNFCVGWICQGQLLNCSPQKSPSWTEDLNTQIRLSNEINSCYFIYRNKRKKKLDFLQEKSQEVIAWKQWMLFSGSLNSDEIGTMALQTPAQRKGMKINRTMYGKRRLNKEVKWYEDENENEKNISIFRL